MKTDYQKKIVVILIIISLFMSFAFCLVIKKNLIACKDVTDETYEATNDIVYLVERAEKDETIGNEFDDYYTISGWAGIKNETSEVFDTKVLLKDDDGYYYALSTDMVQRDDLDDYNKQGISYKYAGFVARVDGHQLDDDKYKICIFMSLDGNNHYVETDKSLVLGE